MNMTHKNPTVSAVPARPQTTTPPETRRSFHQVMPPSPIGNWREKLTDLSIDLTEAEVGRGGLLVMARHTFLVEAVRLYAGHIPRRLLEVHDVAVLTLRDCVFDSDLASAAPVVSIHNVHTLRVERCRGDAILKYNGTTIGPINEIDGIVPVPVLNPE